jgi:hypothetical protein
MHTERPVALPSVHFLVIVTASAADSIVFPEKAANKTSAPQPKTGSNHGDKKAKGGGVDPRFGLHAGDLSANFNFGVEPNGGGISGSASISSAYGGQDQGQGHSSSQSQSFNFQVGSNGFSASQAASQSSSFNSQHPCHYGYEVRHLSTLGGPKIIFPNSKYSSDTLYIEMLIEISLYTFSSSLPQEIRRYIIGI